MQLLSCRPSYFRNQPFLATYKYKSVLRSGRDCHGLAGLIHSYLIPSQIANFPGIGFRLFRCVQRHDWPAHSYLFLCRRIPQSQFEYPAQLWHSFRPNREKSRCLEINFGWFTLACGTITTEAYPCDRVPFSR